MSQRRFLHLRAWAAGIFSLPIHLCYFTLFYLALIAQYSPSLLSIFLAFVSLWAFAAFAILLNDFFDRKSDQLVGKTPLERGHWLTSRQVALILGSLVGLSAFAVFLTAAGNVYTILWILEYLAALAYSAPPIRLKTRGTLGFISDSLIEKPMPVLIIFSLFRYYGIETLVFPFFAEFMDSIFKHQARDLPYDLVAGVHTLAFQLGQKLSNQLLIAVVLPLNVVSGITLVLLGLLAVGLTSFYLLPAALVILPFVLSAFLEARKVIPSNPLTGDPLSLSWITMSFRLFALPALGLAASLAHPQYFFALGAAIVTVIPLSRPVARVARQSLGLPSRVRSGKNIAATSSS